MNVNNIKRLICDLILYFSLFLKKFICFFQHLEENGENVFFDNFEMASPIYVN
jgi:hypothetical protein